MDINELKQNPRTNYHAQELERLLREESRSSGTSLNQIQNLLIWQKMI
jgi:hypothetical protein